MPTWLTLCFCWLKTIALFIFCHNPNSYRDSSLPPAISKSLQHTRLPWQLLQCNKNHHLLSSSQERRWRGRKIERAQALTISARVKDSRKEFQNSRFQKYLHITQQYTDHSSIQIVVYDGVLEPSITVLDESILDVAHGWVTVRGKRRKGNPIFCIPLTCRLWAYLQWPK